MSEGIYSAVVLGTVVEQNVAEQFGKAIMPYSAEEVIKALVHSVINGDLKIKQIGGDADELS